MNKIEQFNKVNLAHLRQEFQTAINAVAEKFGLEAKMNNISFTELQFSCPLKVNIAGKAIDLSGKYPYLNLPKIGTEFFSKGKKFKVVAHELGRPKYPVTAEQVGNATDKPVRIKCTPESVNQRAL